MSQTSSLADLSLSSSYPPPPNFIFQENSTPIIMPLQKQKSTGARPAQKQEPRASMLIEIVCKRDMHSSMKIGSSSVQRNSKKDKIVQRKFQKKIDSESEYTPHTPQARNEEAGKNKRRRKVFASQWKCPAHECMKLYASKQMLKRHILTKHFGGQSDLLQKIQLPPGKYLKRGRPVVIKA